MTAALVLPPEAGEPSQLLAEAARHLCGAVGAKRFRPQLVHLLGQIYDLSEEQLLRIAAAGELIHAASLLHDDVIDSGTERRGKPTANVTWGNSVAVLAGDWLLTRAILEVAPLGLLVMNDAIETVATMTCAAVREVEARGRTDVTYPLWRDIAQGKAGELFAWCAGSVATLGRDAAGTQILRQLGRQLGIAFQMADDLKDILDANGGKDRFADLKNRNPSFALVVAMDRAPALRSRIAKVWETSESPADLPGLGRAVAESGGLEAASALLRDEIRSSLTLLSTVAPPKIVAAFIDLAASFAGSQAALLQGAA